MRVKEESENTGLKLNIKKKMNILLSHPITSWKILKVEIVTDFIFLGSKIMQTVISAMKLKDA